jgi:hypothetical protein
MTDDRIALLLAEGTATDDWERRREIAAELAAGGPDAAFPPAVAMLGGDAEGAVALGAEIVAAIPRTEPLEHETLGTIQVVSGPGFDAGQRAVLIARIAALLEGDGAGELAAVPLLRGARRLDDVALLPAIAARAGDASSEVREVVAWALGGFAEDDPRTIAALLALGADEDPDVRDWALFALGRLREEPVGTPAARALYAANADDPHDDLRDEARAALALLGGAPAATAG